MYTKGCFGKSTRPTNSNSSRLYCCHKRLSLHWLHKRPARSR